MSLLQVLIGIILAGLAVWVLSLFLPLWAAVVIVVIVALLCAYGA